MLKGIEDTHAEYFMAIGIGYLSHFNSYLSYLMGPVYPNTLVFDTRRVFHLIPP